jgi:uncharacterized protein (DUF362 family)
MDEKRGGFTMERMGRRDFLKTSGAIAGAIAFSGFPAILRARTKTAVAIIKSDMDLGAAMTHNLFPCFMENTTEQARQKLKVPEVSWTPESMAEIEGMVEKACKLAGGLPVKKGDTVLIKPNLVQPPHIPMFHVPGFGFDRVQAMLSDVRVATAVASMARKQGARKVIIGEGNASNVTNPWKESGYQSGVAALKDPAVTLLDFPTIPWKNMKPPKALSLKEYALPELIDSIDVMINVAPMKNHMWAGITMTMKNFLGLPAGEVYGSYKAGLPHNNIADVIVDLTAIVQDRVRSNFGIITAIYAGEGVGPLTPEAKPLNCVVAGSDYVALDAVGATVMGWDASAIGSIRKGHGMGLGAMKGIEVLGTSISEIQFAAKPVAEGARQHGGEVTNWETQLGRALPA